MRVGINTLSTANIAIINKLFVTDDNGALLRSSLINVTLNGPRAARSAPPPSYRNSPTSTPSSRMRATRSVPSPQIRAMPTSSVSTRRSSCALSESPSLGRPLAAPPVWSSPKPSTRQTTEGTSTSCATRARNTTRTSSGSRRTTVYPRCEGWSTAGLPGRPTRAEFAWSR